uniref:VWR domain-containing protein n=1 Tax=uncultured Alphaproteobacteria bacterium TaxID=91750 RepID=A0A5Q5AQE8_9PROT|nr:vWR domain-containing protein [uncultured Alphaproteobacteria bacterium]
MAVNLDDYREELTGMAPVLADTLDATFAEAARTMSAQGLKDYLDGARSMVGLGKGPDLLVTYMEEMPLVARECGEDVIRDCIVAVLKLASMTSGDVLVRMLATLPNVARRLRRSGIVARHWRLWAAQAGKAAPVFRNRDGEPFAPGPGQAKNVFTAAPSVSRMSGSSVIGSTSAIWQAATGAMPLVINWAA